MFENVLGTRMILFELPRFNFIYSQYCHCFNWEKKSLQPFSWNFFGPCQFMGTVLLVILQDFISCTGIMDQKAKNSKHITSKALLPNFVILTYSPSSPGKYISAFFAFIFIRFYKLELLWFLSGLEFQMHLNQILLSNPLLTETRFCFLHKSI